MQKLLECSGPCSWCDGESIERLEQAPDMIRCALGVFWGVEIYVRVRRKSVSLSECLRDVKVVNFVIVLIGCCTHDSEGC